MGDFGSQFLKRFLLTGYSRKIKTDGSGTRFAGSLTGLRSFVGFSTFSVIFLVTLCSSSFELWRYTFTSINTTATATLCDDWFWVNGFCLITSVLRFHVCLAD